MMDYAARLNAMGQAPPPVPDYSRMWRHAPGVYGQGPLAAAGYQLSAEGAMVTPEQRSILDAILGFYNSAGGKS